MSDEKKSPSLDIILSIDKCNNKPCSSKAVTKRIYTSYGDIQKLFHRVCCNKWICHRCGIIKKQQLHSLMLSAIKENDLTRFLTLPLKPNPNDDIEAQCKKIKKYWSRLRQEFARKYKASILFIWILERKKDGMPHLHIFVDRFIPQRWVSRKWNKIGGGKITHIRKLRESELSNRVDYVLKHFNTWDRYNLPIGTRRYGSSKGLLKKQDSISSDWDFTCGTIDELYEKYREEVVEEKRDEFENLISFSIFEGQNLQ